MAAICLSATDASIVDERRLFGNRGHVIIVEDPGKAQYLIERFLRKSAPFTVICENRERVQALRAQHVDAIHGDASVRKILIRANTISARRLILAVADAARASRIVDGARRLNKRLLVTDALASSFPHLLIRFLATRNSRTGIPKATASYSFSVSRRPRTADLDVQPRSVWRILDT
jgi:voltage-gated potassium channel Kch